LSSICHLVFVIVIQFLTGVSKITSRSKLLLRILHNIADHNRVHRLNYIQFFPPCTKLSFFLPHFLSLDPCAEHIPAPIKNDQVRIRPRPEGSLPIINAKAARRIERHTFNRFTQRTTREPRKVADAAVEGDDAEARQQSDTDRAREMAETHLPARVSVPSRYSFAPSFTNRLPSRHSCTPSLRCGSRIFIATSAL
jgi:hypothetical protein